MSNLYYCRFTENIQHRIPVIERRITGFRSGKPVVQYVEEMKFIHHKKQEYIGFSDDKAVLVRSGYPAERIMERDRFNVLHEYYMNESDTIEFKDLRTTK